VKIYLSTSPKAPPANVSLTRTGGVVDLDIDDHREGTSIHFHGPAPLIIIVHKRSGGDTDPEVKYVIAAGTHHRYHPAVHRHEMASALVTHHHLLQGIRLQRTLKISLPSCTRCVKIRMNTTGRQMTDLCTLKEIIMFLCIRPFRPFLLAAAQLKPGGYQLLLEGEGEEYPLGPTMIVNHVQANSTLIKPPCA
jgi:hypothetical protein